MILKYGLIFIAMIGLIISSTLINVNADNIPQDEKSIAAYVSPNSPLLNEFKSRINLQGPQYFLTSNQHITNLVLRYQQH